MKIFDVTVPIKNFMPVWPGDPQVENRLVSSIEKGEEANVTNIQMSAHTGTHIDAPKHYIKSGTAIEGLSLTTLLGEVEVVEIDFQNSQIDALTLIKVNRNEWSQRVLFKTNNSNLRLLEKDYFNQNFTALLPDAAEYLVQKGVKLVGIDYLSIAPFENGSDTHIILLENDVVVLEGLNLADISPGIYELIALPILLEGAEGSPARVLLIQS
ncbi:MAG: cyclase [Chloroflexi bacterium HGW-Chloroflexi-2]|jgi:arylformamidase|nr:MAG: cyclase [Chloroflexi bacterium HGW-Chloroflexi-2]